MKKGITKDKISISNDKDLHEKLKAHCEDNMIKLSTYIEHLIKKSMK